MSRLKNSWLFVFLWSSTATACLVVDCPHVADDDYEHYCDSHEMTTTEVRELMEANLLDFDWKACRVASNKISARRSRARKKADQNAKQAELEALLEENRSLKEERERLFRIGVFLAATNDLLRPVPNGSNYSMHTPQWGEDVPRPEEFNLLNPVLPPGGHPPSQ